MTGVPQLDLPDILVDDEEQREKRKTSSSALLNPYGPQSPSTPGSAGLRSPTTGAAFLSPNEARNSGGAGGATSHQKTWSAHSADLTLQTNFDSSGAVHPLSMPRAGEASSAKGDAHQSTHSAFSFELPGSANSSAANSRRNSRSNSAVSPIQMSQILDDSIWMASIRRSATMKRKPGW